MTLGLIVCKSLRDVQADGFMKAICTVNFDLNGDEEPGA